MRPLFAIAATTALLVCSGAIAQPASRDANTPAVTTPNSPPNPGAPVSGANSFTEGQAKSRIETAVNIPERSAAYRQAGC
jgi:hypothetical protein